MKQKLLSLLVALLACTSLFADEVTFSAGTDTSSTTSLTKNGITLTATTFNNSSYYQAYKGATFTVSSSAGKISKVEITCTASGTAKYGPGCFTGPTTGSYTASSGTIGVWEGDAESLSLTASENQVRMTKIVITYTNNSAASTPTLTAGGVFVTTPYQVTITNNESGSTVYYTTDGTEPTTESPSFTGENKTLPISGTTTVKAMSVITGKANSFVSSATYTYKEPYKSISFLKEVSTADGVDVAAILTGVAVTYADSKKAYIEDAGGNGLYIYGANTLKAGNLTTATFIGQMKTYNGLIEFIPTSITVTKEEEVVISATEVTIEELNTNFSKYESVRVKIVGATTTEFSSKSATLTQNGNTIDARAASTDITTVNGTTVDVVGYPGLYNTTKQLNVLTQDDITVKETATKQTPTITATYKKEMTVGDADDEYTVEYDGDGELTITSSDEAVAEAIIVGKDVLVSAKTAGTTTITVSAPETDNYYAKTLSYSLEVSVAALPAELPFSFDGGVADVATTQGMSQTGLGTDYKSSPYLKFDSTGDSLVIHIAGSANVLQYTIKGNSFSESTFDVLESPNGDTYTKNASYEELAGSNIVTQTLKADTRYVKFVYTEKKYGNAALGAIRIYNAYTRQVAVGDYGTICLPQAVEPEKFQGATFYTVSNIEKGVLELKPVETLSAGVPYIYEATSDLVVCECSGEAANEPATQGYLTGVFTDTPAILNTYVLQKQNEKFGFYRVDEAGITTVGANHAYLTVASGVQSFHFDITEATAVEEVSATKADAPIYDLQGRLVVAPIKGQLYIQNGKTLVF